MDAVHFDDSKNQKFVDMISCFRVANMFMLLKNENVEHLSVHNGHFYGRDIEMCLHQ